MRVMCTAQHREDWPLRVGCWCVNGLVGRRGGVRVVLVRGHVPVRAALARLRRKVGDRHGHRAEVCCAPHMQLWCDAGQPRVRLHRDG